MAAAAAAAATFSLIPPTIIDMPDSMFPAAICACPTCGTAIDLPAEAQRYAALLQQAQRQIAELQAQVRTLNQLSKTATTTSDPTAVNRPSSSPTTSSTGTGIAAPTTTRTSFLGAGRISQLFGSRGNNTTTTNTTATNNNNIVQQPANSPSPPSAPPIAANNSRPTTPAANILPPNPHLSPNIDSPSAESLLKELLLEKKLRAAAEARVDDTSKEVEELSVTLFEQANEMVASERRARAKLEERVSVLEQRDVEKRVRLDRLEGAMSRLDRVRALLGDNSDGGGSGGGGAAAGS